jgi:alkanesulfonate monooxygenase SsuD/methylene tetrahydromethanopterin reductase-like flavin-dependent oxidoreductase (luciferase family)
MFLMRFDMRISGDASTCARDLYRAALEMAAWGEDNGCASVVLSEHHASPDGYLPAPLILASAIAGRTSRLPIQIAAVLVNFYDPVRLAEEMAILDILSEGRVSYVLGLGYRPEEHAMFGVPMHGRGRRMEQMIAVLRQAWSGEPFEFRGRSVHVTPKPVTPGGPPLLMGGNSIAAVRRAARCRLGILTQVGDASLATEYLEECERQGVQPGTCLVPPPGTVTCAFVAEDPDRAWEEVGPYFLHDAKMYAAWLQGQTAAVTSAARTVEELRLEDGAYRIFTPAEAVQYIRANGMLVTHPLCGGLPPRLAWQSLKLIETRVLPEVERSMSSLI